MRDIVFAAALLVIMLLSALVIAGCQFNVSIAGGRSVGNAPFARSDSVLDSSGTQQAHDLAGLEPGGSPAAQDMGDAKQVAPGTLQNQQTGRDVRNQRATDATGGTGQSNVQGRESGDQTNEGERDDALEVDVSPVP